MRYIKYVVYHGISIVTPNSMIDFLEINFSCATISTDTIELYCTKYCVSRAG